MCLSSPLSVCLLLPSPGNSVPVLYPSLAPSITTPWTQVMMQFMSNILLPYIATERPPQGVLELRVYSGFIISWTVSLSSLPWAFLTILQHYDSLALLCSVRWMDLQHSVVIPVWIVKIDCGVSNFSSCAPCWVSHCLSYKSYSTGPGCFGRGSCAIHCWSSAALLGFTHALVLLWNCSLRSEYNKALICNW